MEFFLNFHARKKMVSFVPLSYLNTIDKWSCCLGDREDKAKSQSCPTELKIKKKDCRWVGKDGKGRRFENREHI